MPFTTAHKVAILNHYYGGTALGAPANLFIGLSSTTPAADGTNFTEPVDGVPAFKDGYSRVSVANNTTKWPTATSAEPSVKSNGEEESFAACSGNAWPEVTHWGIFVDNAPATAPVDWALLTVAKTIGVGDVAKFAVGELKTRMQNP